MSCLKDRQLYILLTGRVEAIEEELLVVGQEIIRLRADFDRYIEKQDSTYFCEGKTNDYCG